MYWMCEVFRLFRSAVGVDQSHAGAALLEPVALAGCRSSSPQSRSWHRTTSPTDHRADVRATRFLAVRCIRPRERGSTRAWGGRTGSAFVDMLVPRAYAERDGKESPSPSGCSPSILAIPFGPCLQRAEVDRRADLDGPARLDGGGVRPQRRAHRLYGMNVWYDGWFRTTVWLLQLPVAALLLTRLLAPARRPGQRRLELLGRAVARSCAAGTIVMVLAVAASGRDGGRTLGVDGAGLNVTRTMVWIGLLVFIAAVTAFVYRAQRITPARQARAEREEIESSPR